MAKRVYFAFDYQDVIDFRANVVRNHNTIKGGQNAGYFDGSIWETAQKTSDIALKRMINSELKGTSVTVVLVGSRTYARRWVRYEIMKSVERGNSLLAIHINQIKDKNNCTKILGPNPFSYLGMVIEADRITAKPVAHNGQTWEWYGDLAPFPIPKSISLGLGNSVNLKSLYPIYDWVDDDGYNNFEDWIS